MKHRSQLIAFALAATSCGSTAPIPTRAPEASTSAASAPAAASAAPAPAESAPAPPPTSTTSTTSTEERPATIGARHVLIMYMGSERAPASVVRTKEQARAVAEEVLRRARAGEDMARLAVEYSDEPGAGSRGGSLGVFGHGRMVRVFEDAAFALKVGEVSDVVESGFGFHVIQRTQ